MLEWKHDESELPGEPRGQRDSGRRLGTDGLLLRRWQCLQSNLRFVESALSCVLHLLRELLAARLLSPHNQVANPVTLFPTDNNGVIVELPSVSGNAASINGSLVFGIGTESNNQLPNTATVFTLTCDDFSTAFGGNTYGITNAVTCAGPGSFIDSGSNGLFFPDATGIPACPTNTPIGDLSSFYCPTATESLSATNYGGNGTSKTSNFSVANAETIYTTTSTEADAALSGLAA